MTDPRLRLALTAGLALTCLGLALHGADPRALPGHLAGVSPLGVGLGLAGLGLTFLLRTARYGLLVGPGAAPRDVLLACAVGFFAIQTLPLRMGELVRPTLLDEAGVPWARALGAVAVERFFDLLALSGLIALTGQVDLPPIEIAGIDVIRTGSRLIATSAGVLGLGLVALGVGGGALAEWAPARLARPVRQLTASTRELSLLRGIGALALSGALWVNNVFTVAAFLWAVPGAPAGLQVALSVCAATVTGVLAVPTPGMVGSFEAGVRASLWVWSTPAEIAAVVALVWHGSTFAFHGAAGLAALAWRGWSLSALVVRSRQRGG